MLTWAEIKIAIQFLPEVFSMIKAIAKRVQEGVEEARMKNALKIFDIALDKALTSKDTTDLEDIFRGKNP